MRKVNPVLIPRNHHIENVIQQCVTSGSPESAYAFLDVLRKPYEASEQASQYQDQPIDGDENYQTFCGT